MSRQVQLLRLLLPDLDASLAASTAAQQRWREVAAALQELADAAANINSSANGTTSAAVASWGQQEAQLMYLVQAAIG
jgi:hypothetical protein